MSKVKVKLNKAGVGELLKSKEVASYLESMAYARVPQNGGSYEVGIHTGSQRTNAYIKTADWAAYSEEMKNNTLIKAIK